MFLAIWWYWRILIKAKLLTLASIRTTAFHTLSLYFMQLSRGWFPPKTRCSWKLPTKSIKSYHLMSCFGKIDGIWIVLECPWPKTCIVPTPDSRIRSGNLVLLVTYVNFLNRDNPSKRDNAWLLSSRFQAALSWLDLKAFCHWSIMKSSKMDQCFAHNMRSILSFVRPLSLRPSL